MKYIVEIKKTRRTGYRKEPIYLKWFKNGMVHVVFRKEEATRYHKRDLEKIKMIFENRVIIHKEGK